MSPTFICADSESPSRLRPKAFMKATFLELHSMADMPVIYQSQNCLMVWSISFSFLMNSSSVRISSSGDSRVKRLRMGTPSLARRSNLRRISYFSFMRCSSDIFRWGAKNFSAFRFSRPSRVRMSPTSFSEGIRRGSSFWWGADSLKEGSSTAPSSGRSMFTDSAVAIFGLVRKSAPKISPIYLF